MATEPRPGNQQLVEEYEDLFTGLDKLKDYQVHLHINKDVQPSAQPHRRVPFHVRKQLEEQLEIDERNGVIERVQGPIPWVSPVVVAPNPKQPGKIRMCVDMRQANKAIQRERHITPTIKEVIGDLNGAKVFSKLDLNQGYDQLELTPNPAILQHLAHTLASEDSNVSTSAFQAQQRSSRMRFARPSAE